MQLAPCEEDLRYLAGE
jgi:hypothetical protein